MILMSKAAESQPRQFLFTVIIKNAHSVDRTNGNRCENGVDLTIDGLALRWHWQSGVLADRRLHLRMMPPEVEGREGGRQGGRGPAPGSAWVTWPFSKFVNGERF